MLQLQNIYLILMIIMFYLFISRGLQEKNDNRYAACYEAAKKVILKYKELQKVEELHKASPLTVSYYYDRAQDAGLVGKCMFITFSIDQEPRDITDNTHNKSKIATHLCSKFWLLRDVMPQEILFEL